MFDKEFAFTGKHADYVDKLTSNPFSEQSSLRGLFKSNIDLFLLAPMVGVIYNRRSLKDNSVSLNTKIFTDQFTPRTDDLNFIYKTILLNDRDTQNVEERVENAFRKSYDDQLNKANESKFYEYLLGGVEILYEKIIENTTNYDELLMNYVNFITEFNKMYNQNIYQKGSIFELDDNSDLDL